MARAGLQSSIGQGWREWCTFIPTITTVATTLAAAELDESRSDVPRVGSLLAFDAFVGKKRYHETVAVTRCERPHDFAWRGGLGPGATSVWAITIGHNYIRHNYIEGLGPGATSVWAITIQAITIQAINI